MDDWLNRYHPPGSIGKTLLVEAAVTASWRGPARSHRYPPLEVPQHAISSGNHACEYPACKGLAGPRKALNTDARPVLLSSRIGYFLPAHHLNQTGAASLSSLQERWRLWVQYKRAKYPTCTKSSEERTLANKQFDSACFLFQDMLAT